MKKHRLAKDLTQPELANLLGVNPSRVSTWERKVSKVPAERAIQLESVFGCKAEDLDIEIVGGIEAVEKARKAGRPSRLKLFCNSHKITGLSVMKKTGMSKTAISSYFRGKIPAPDIQRRIADALGVTRDKLFPTDIERYGK